MEYLSTANGTVGAYAKTASDKNVFESLVYGISLVDEIVDKDI